MKSMRYFLFLLAFIEGASVMACELFSAKMIAPFFGGSLEFSEAIKQARGLLPPSSSRPGRPTIHYLVSSSPLHSLFPCNPPPTSDTSDTSRFPRQKTGVRSELSEGSSGATEVGEAAADTA